MIEESTVCNSPLSGIDILSWNPLFYSLVVYGGESITYVRRCEMYEEYDYYVYISRVYHNLCINVIWWIGVLVDWCGHDMNLVLEDVSNTLIVVSYTCTCMCPYADLIKKLIHLTYA